MSDVTQRSTTRTAQLLAAVLAVVLLVPAIAQAARPAAIARELERSPLYVDPAYADALAPEDERALRAAIDRRPGTTRLLLTALVPGDAADGRARTLIELVRQRLRDAGEDADGTYAVVDGSYVTATTYRQGEEVLGDDAARDAAFLANNDDGEGGRPSYREPVGAVALRFLRQLARPAAQRSAAAERLRATLRREYEARQREQAGDGGGVPLVVVLAVVALVVLGAALLLYRRRGARVADGPLPVIPDRVFEHARAARRAELREDADEQLLALGEALDAQPVPEAEAAQEAYQEALDATTAARRRMRPDAPSVDLVGVLVLIDRARGLLARAAALDAGRRPPEPDRLCTYHPLHGRAASTVEWRPGLRVPACAACAADVRAGRTPDALRDGDRPYFEADSVWARTGFGALADDLVARVSRGER
ncbi:hypothetical protein SK069_10960 [Patulibacter brassicae]|uniref:TPM domain-containing protein n=1 Tax=Patulibacter brassicae TaxID=1705717 RepID=A0ABU4VKV4_9ACTN|nr:hypothetical protein [Patulibacter brassicae]MDX8152115.1 hypothetical protein [Patulibacter brassicae]